MLRAVDAPGGVVGPVAIGIGDLVVARHPAQSFTTVLGSCIAIGLWDPVSQVGGLNHFLLAHSQGEASRDLRYGDTAIPALVGKVEAAGADLRRIRAIVVGGANMIRAMLPIGTENAAFARDWLAEQRIPVVSEDTGGVHARRLSFTPGDGSFRISAVDDAPGPYS
ncbi:MAG: chemotaxis protein CheD [Pseudomonadota bacterium]